MQTVDREELLSEFEMLQGKIDKVGDFSFRVKAWSISLTTAVVVGSVSGQIAPFATSIALLGIGGFALLEKNQSIWKKAFEKRCRVIDGMLRRDSMKQNPHLAIAWAKSVSEGNPQSLIQAVDMAAKEQSRTACGRLYLKDTGFFYWGQVLLVLAVIVMQQLRPHKDESKTVTVEWPDSALELRMTPTVVNPLRLHEDSPTSSLPQTPSATEPLPSGDSK